MSYKKAAMRELKSATKDAKEIISQITENNRIGFGLFITIEGERFSDGKVAIYTVDDTTLTLPGITCLLYSALRQLPEDLKLPTLDSIMVEMRKRIKNHATIPS